MAKNVFRLAKTGTYVGDRGMLKFWRKNREKDNSKRHIHDVSRETKTVDQGGKVYLPKAFREKLGIQVGDEVEVELYTLYGEIRIRKKERVS